jgi:hypothetical protein
MGIYSGMALAHTGVPLLNILERVKSLEFGSSLAEDQKKGRHATDISLIMGSGAAQAVVFGWMGEMTSVNVSTPLDIVDCSFGHYTPVIVNGFKY